MTNSAFIRGDLIDSKYYVDFFLYEDEITETYRVKTNKNELKYLKLIKSECTSILEVEALKEALDLINKNSHQSILTCSELQALRVEGQFQYYFIHDFVHGESLKQRLDRDISIAVYDACKIIRAGFDILSNVGMPSTQVLTPNDIFINYLDEKGSVSILPLDLNCYIKHTEPSILRYSLAYQSRDAEHNTNYSLATLLYRCLFGFLPWQYDIEWKATYKAVQYQVFSYRDSSPLSQSTFYSQHIPDDLKSIVFQALNNIGVNEFSKKLDLFIKQYYEFPYYDDIQLPNSETRNIKLKVSEDSHYKSAHVGLSKIAGMMDLKSLLITDIIEPLKNKQAYKEYGIKPLNGLLFYGPPGCGKTFIAKQLAAELGYTFFEIKPSDLASTYVHGTQEKIGKLFLEASLKAPSVIFIDEVDAVMPSRDSANMGQHYSSEVNEFLAQLTECSEKGILTIMATNRPDAIDKAILRTGRVDKAVYIPLPDFNTRKEMLKILLEGRPIDSGLDLDSIAMLMAHYTSSDVNYIVNEAAKLALKESSKIGYEHLTEVLRKTKSSVNYEQIKKYNSFTELQKF
ncbi:AAA family ATPase [Psychrobacter sp. FME13]|uniref:ATP-binding protein n=1 Tax=Psychrobacter sp. FME13 TaxID=2487708 RepID=UPI00178788E4|nr:AAA family ATPase [Psychrobacter sp. FME13]MBE0442084.1 AAA family ATPase [Psychrobacter sp. FME13]